MNLFVDPDWDLSLFGSTLADLVSYLTNGLDLFPVNKKGKGIESQYMVTDDHSVVSLLSCRWHCIMGFMCLERWQVAKVHSCYRILLKLRTIPRHKNKQLSYHY